MAPFEATVWNPASSDNGIPVSWLWQGILARSNVTLLTSLWKSGKSTLIALLLERRRAGGRLLGRAVEAGATLVVSEEARQHWAVRLRKLDFGGRAHIYCRPFEKRSDLSAWQAFIDHILEQQATHGIDLVIIDTIARFLPCNENNAASQLNALNELVRLTERGIAVLLLHHPTKGEPRLQQAARGAGGLPAFADIVLEMRIPPGAPGTRRRRLHGFSRYEETPRHLVAELNNEGTDYAVLLENDDQQAHAPALDVVAELLGDSDMPLTREDLLARWPMDRTPPSAGTLWRWLTRGMEVGMLVREGAGTKADAFRYRLAG